MLKIMDKITFKRFKRFKPDTKRTGIGQFVLGKICVMCLFWAIYNLTLEQYVL